MTDYPVLTIVCDHVGTPKRNRRFRRLATVTHYGMIGESVPNLEVEYFYDERDDQHGRVEDYSDPHSTYPFRCPQCKVWDVKVRSTTLGEIASSGASSLSLSQLAAMIERKR